MALVAGHDVVDQGSFRALQNFVSPGSVETAAIVVSSWSPSSIAIDRVHGDQRGHDVPPKARPSSDAYGLREIGKDYSDALGAERRQIVHSDCLL